jgi:hypothetical protein
MTKMATVVPSRARRHDNRFLRRGEIVPRREASPSPMNADCSIVLHSLGGIAMKIASIAFIFPAATLSGANGQNLLKNSSFETPAVAEGTALKQQK